MHATCCLPEQCICERMCRECRATRACTYMQVAEACQASDSCFTYGVFTRDESAYELSVWPGMALAAAEAGYTCFDELVAEAHDSHEVVYLMSEFCLTPPGDTATRRGFWDALMVGCIPVVFDERSRDWPAHFIDGNASAVSVFVDPHAVAADPARLEAHLRAMQPQVPAMRAAIAQQAAGFQWAFADLSKTEHEEVGPDALDRALHALMQLGRSGSAADGA